ncbi:ATP-binding protein [Sulfitobacter sp.]|uniref:ATP-binding protein n=1 Tax=Sulfitobacter sp. TaxID=1903071 RepID=UPI003001AA2F
MDVDKRQIQDIPFTVKLPDVLRSIRFRLQFLFLLIALPAVIMIVVLNMRERLHRIDVSRLIAQRAVEQVIATQAELIEDTRRFLINLTKVPAIRNPAGAECKAFLEQTASLTPHYINLGVPLADGQLLCSAVPLTKPVNVYDRPYFRKAIERQNFSIGTFQIDRAAHVTSVNFAYPVYDATSQTAPIGAAVAVLSLDWWSVTLEDAGLPEGTVAFIVDNSRNIIATYPNQTDLLGKPLTQAGLALDEVENVNQEVISKTDNVRRTFRQSMLTDGIVHNNVYMILGVPVGIGIEAANQRMFNYLLGLGAALAAIWYIAGRLMEASVFNPIRAMNREIRHLEYGGALSSDYARDQAAKQVLDFQGIMQSFRNISQKRRRVEEERDTKSEEMAALIDALPDTYFRIDREGRILECKTSQLADLYIQPEKQVGRKMSGMLPKAAGDLFDEKIREHLETGEIVTWEYPLEVSGRVQDFEARICRIINHDEMVVVVRNVSERKQAVKQREIAETRLERTIASLPGVTISLDMTDPNQPNIIFVSSQSEAIWGYTPEEIYANQELLITAHDPKDREGMYKRLSDAARDLSTFKRRFQITTKTGERKWLETLTGASRVEDGNVRTDGFILDVTAEVETQAQLEVQREVVHRAQKHESIGQLTGGVAHDFNNLLAVIMGNLELLRDDMTDADHIEMIDAGIQATKRGADLTRNMLAFARKARLSPEVVDLNRLVNETRNWAGRTLPANISVETSLSADLWETEADPSSIESALLNLILNARDAMQDGGELMLETANVHVHDAYIDSRQEKLAPGCYVMLSVSDTGEGISGPILSRIFEPFFSTKPTGKGSGLGLSMVQGFMHQSGGTVQVYSEWGVGTSFNLYFKALTDELVCQKIEETFVEPHQANGRRILVAEDESEVLAVIVTMLEKAGYDVTSASTGDEARAIFDASPDFDLLLTDIVMPGTLQGTTLSKVLREQVPDLRVIFMSGYANEATVRGNDLRPEDIRLMKPVIRADLLAALSKSLNG